MSRWNDASRRPLGFRTEALGLSDAAFSLLRDLVAERTGIYFEDSKRDTFGDKVSDLIVARGLSSFLDYYYLLRYDPQADMYWRELRDRLAVPETFFWRHSEHLDTLACTIAPAHFARAPNAPLRIWSAACCTGEEPLSIAMALAEAGWLARGRIEIVASDSSSAVVERARRGVYGERSFRTLPLHLRERYFRQDGDGWHVDAALLASVRFTVANLMDRDEAGPLASADVIFCRNVFIYFSDSAIRRVVAMFAERMPPHGHLFLGVAESLARHGTAFTMTEMGRSFVYVKRSPLEAVAP